MTDMNDLCVKMWLNEDRSEEQISDVHWRAKYGKGCASM